MKYTKTALKEALKEVASTILKCERAQLKFREGSSQYSLLRNRIKAMVLSKGLIEEALKSSDPDNTEEKDQAHLFSEVELSQALEPVLSIIRKCEKALVKFEPGNVNHKRFSKIIEPMRICQNLIEDKIQLLE